jgi:peptidoglycan/LPS O-acetylase OafA/YrhL
MTVAADDRLLASGDEAGTAPGDRKFRPDVQGLRALAILLVILFHAGIPAISGGFVGVDVFFVISGFVITGVLLRESASTGKTSIVAFYGRRARRIIPAATLVIIATVVASYIFLSSASSRETAVDGQWASIFLINFHFVATSTNYLSSITPPSPLQNFWSLAVEEQFYLVYPAVFLIVAGFFARPSLRIRLAIVLGLTVVGSYTLSVALTSSDPSIAFFSPFTRAWELALGALIAVTSHNLRRLPASIAAAATWIGLGGILVAAFVFTSATAYPGSLAAVPVIGAGLIIAGGTAQPTWGVEAILRLRPFQLLGLISYSLYLWHWPILTIAAQRDGKNSLSVSDNIILLVFALLMAIGTYLLIENPIRHSKFLVTRRWLGVAMGGCLVLSSLIFTTSEVHHDQNTAVVGTANGGVGTHCPPTTAGLSTSMQAELGVKQGQASNLHSAKQLRMLVVGDSTACTLMPGLAAVGSLYGLQVDSGAVIGCGIVSGRIAPAFYSIDPGVDVEMGTDVCAKRAFGAEMSAIRRDSPNIILWSSTWEKASILVNTRSGHKVLLQGTPQWQATMLQRMEARLQQFIATGATVILLEQPPFVDSGKPARPTASDLAFHRLNEILLELAARHPGHVRVVNLSSRVCPSGPPCPFVIAGLTVRPDDAHYGPAGSLWVAKWLVPQILEAMKSTR